jgi:hypothetical protein
MEVVLLLSAERDLQEAYNWIEGTVEGKSSFSCRLPIELVPVTGLELS